MNQNTPETVNARFKKDLHKEALKICAGLAYGDLRRTLDFNDVSDKEKLDFREKMYGLIFEWINDKLFSLTDPQSEFKRSHEEICGMIKKEAVSSNLFKNNKFTIGQAQKWLNMTLKNILIFNLCPDKMSDKLISSLHVPVDSIIIKKAWQLDEVELPLKNGVNPHLITRGVHKGRTRLDCFLPWSQWDDYDDYFEFQTTLRKRLGSSSDYSSTIEWEFKAFNQKQDITIAASDANDGMVEDFLQRE